MVIHEASSFCWRTSCRRYFTNAVCNLLRSEYVHHHDSRRVKSIGAAGLEPAGRELPSCMPIHPTIASRAFSQHSLSPSAPNHEHSSRLVKVCSSLISEIPIELYCDEQAQEHHSHDEIPLCCGLWHGDAGGRSDHQYQEKKDAQHAQGLYHVASIATRIKWIKALFIAAPCGLRYNGAVSGYNLIVKNKNNTTRVP